MQLLLTDGRAAPVPQDALSAADQDWVLETAGFRKWRNREGHETRARLLAFDGETVRLENDQLSAAGVSVRTCCVQRFDPQV